MGDADSPENRNLVLARNFQRHLCVACPWFPGKRDFQFVRPKVDTRIIQCLEHFCTTKKQVKLRSHRPLSVEGMGVILAECYVEDFETRGIDHGQEVLQVTTETFKQAGLERREDKACQRGRIAAMPVMTRFEAEFYGKCFELVQRGQGSYHRHNSDVPETRIFRRESSTRCLADDETRFGNPRNGIHCERSQTRGESTQE